MMFCKKCQEEMNYFCDLCDCCGLCCACPYDDIEVDDESSEEQC
jgi:hypothetical protein